MGTWPHNNAPAGDPSSRRVALIVAVAWFMQNLDTTIIATSLPQIARTFGVTPIEINAGITANVLAGAALIPLGGWLTDRFGPRRVFAAAIAVFGLASVGSAAASNLAMFVMTRAMQGAGGALMVPVGRIAVLRNTNPANLLRMTALITYPGLIAPVIAPVIGGALTTWLGWPAIFLVNVPIAILGIVLVLAFVPDGAEQDSTPLDWVGTVLVIVSLSMSVYGLSALAGPSSPGVDLAFIAVGIGSGALAIRWLRRKPHPLVDLTPLQVPTFASTTVYAGNVIRASILAFGFVLPLMFQQAWGLPPVQAGNIILVYALGNLAMKILTTPILRALGFRLALFINGAAAAMCIAACALLTAETNRVAVFAMVFAAGATRSLQFTALNTLSFADIEPQHRSDASTIFSMMQQFSMALGVAAAAAALGAAGPPTQAAFTGVFVAIGAITLVGTIWTLRLPPDAGHLVAGRIPHRPTADDGHRR